MEINYFNIYEFAELFDYAISYLYEILNAPYNEAVVAIFQGATVSGTSIIYGNHFSFTIGFYIPIVSEIGGGLFALMFGWVADVTPSFIGDTFGKCILFGTLTATVAITAVHWCVKFARQLWPL